MDAGAREDTTQRQIESPRPPRQCCVIGRGQVEAQHLEDRPQKALRLAEGQVKEQAERQRGFDGDVRVLQLPAPLADTRGFPPGDRLRRQPESDVALLNQRSIVRRPVSDAVFRFILGMHSRLHVEIMLLRPSRWPGRDEYSFPRTNAITREEWAGTCAVFDALDVDGDGRVTPQELAAGLGVAFCLEDGDRSHAQ